MKNPFQFTILGASLIFFSSLFSAPSAKFLSSTEGDFAGYVASQINTCNGDYCETLIDLQLKEAKELFLQRTYNSRNYLSGKGSGSWRVFSHLFLVAGQDQGGTNKEMGAIGEPVCALVGETNGSILTYTGYKSENTLLKIDLLSNGKGIVNTHNLPITAKTNRQNQVLYAKGKTFELILGNKNRRIYEKVDAYPSSFLGEELLPTLVAQVENPSVYRLKEELLQDDRRLAYFYNALGHLESIELRDDVQSKTIGWMLFSYQPQKSGYLIKVQTSENQILEYELSASGTSKAPFFLLTKVVGTALPACQFDYHLQDGSYLLSKKTYSTGSVVTIDYNAEKKVQYLQESSFEDRGKHYYLNYDEGVTSVKSSFENKRLYEFDEKGRLKYITQFDDEDNAREIEEKFWGDGDEDAGRLIATTILDGDGNLRFHETFKYDAFGNVIEEKKQEIVKILGHDEIKESLKTYAYSSDGFHLLSQADSLGNEKSYRYAPETDLLLQEIVYKDGEPLKKVTYSSNAKKLIDFVEENLNVLVHRKNEYLVLCKL